MRRLWVSLLVAGLGAALVGTVPAQAVPVITGAVTLVNCDTSGCGTGSAIVMGGAANANGNAAGTNWHSCTVSPADPCGTTLPPLTGLASAPNCGASGSLTIKFKDDENQDATWTVGIVTQAAGTWVTGSQPSTVTVTTDGGTHSSSLRSVGAGTCGTNGYSGTISSVA